MNTSNNRKYFVIFSVFIILMEQFFYLLDTSTINVRGLINYDDIWMVIYLIFILYLYISLKYYDHNHSALKVSKIGIYILLLIISILVSGITSMIFLNEGYVEGIRSQRWFFIILMSYFPLKKLFEQKRISSESMTTVIILLGVIESIIYLTQVVVDWMGGPIFLHTSYNYNYDSIRLYIDSCEIIVMTIFSAGRLMRKFSIKYIACIVLGLCYELFVSKGRLENLALMTALVICFLLSKKQYIKKTVFIICLSVCVILVVQRMSFAKWIIQTISDVINQQSIGTMSVRYAARKIYHSLMNKNPLSYIFGLGYPNVNSKSTHALMSGYIIEDNGFSAFFFVYGIMGSIVVFMLLASILKKTFILLRNDGDSSYLCFFVFMVIIAYNMIFWWWKADWTFIVVIMIIMVELRCKEIENEKINKQFGKTEVQGFINSLK